MTSDPGGVIVGTAQLKMLFSKPRAWRVETEKRVADEQAEPAWKNPMAWLPHSIAEAALSGGGGADAELPAAWAHLQERLTAAERLVVSTPVNKNRVDYAAGMRHLMVLLAVGIDMALRVDPDPVLAVNRAGMDDIVTWGLRVHERHPAGR